MAAGQLLALDEFMAASRRHAGDFYPGLIAAVPVGTARPTACRRTGRPWPWSTTPRRSTDAGVAAPPTTWDELRAAGQALLDATGAPGIVIPPDFARYLAFHYAAGGAVISEDGTPDRHRQPRRAQRRSSSTTVSTATASPTTPADVGAEWPGDALAKELGVIVFEGNWIFPFLQENAPDSSSASPRCRPVRPARRRWPSRSRSRSTPTRRSPDAAWTVINYLTGPEGMGKWTSLGLAMPSRVGARRGLEPAVPGAGAVPRRRRVRPRLAARRRRQAFFNDANAELQGLFAGEQDVATTLAEHAGGGRGRASR